MTTIGLDITDAKHIYYLLSFCGAHRNCDECSVIEFCKKLEVKVLHAIKYPKDSQDVEEEDLLMVLNLRAYCNDCERCIIGCKREIECEKLMRKIVEDHKENSKEKELANGSTK